MWWGVVFPSLVAVCLTIVGAAFYKSGAIAIGSPRPAFFIRRKQNPVAFWVGIVLIAAGALGFAASAMLHWLKFKM